MDAGRVSLRQIFQDAAACMEPHQRIVSPALELAQQRAVSAIEIMDEQADTGVYHVTDPNFDPLRPLQAEEVLTIIDRLFQAEMTWHSGQDLSQTVFTCLYVLHLDNLPSATSTPSTSEPGPPIELLSLVLHSYAMAVLKSVDLASQEYARGNVLEQEDVSLHTNGQSLHSEVQVEDVVEELGEAYRWLSEYAQDHPSPAYRMLLDRIQLRSGYLVSLAITIDTTLGCEADPDMHRQHIDSALEALDDVASTPHLLYSTKAIEVAFDPLVARVLPYPNPCPLRSFDMVPWAQACTLMHQNIDGFVQALAVRRAEGWLAWNSYFKQLARSGMPSLSTSLACSVFYSEPLKTIALKREYPLSALARSYASEWAGVSPQQLEAWETADGPTSRWFLSKLAGQLVNICSTLSQNRPRQQRKLLELVSEWKQLIEDVSRKPFEDVTEALEEACRATLVDVALEAYLAGLELDLYDTVGEEGAMMFWVLSSLSSYKLEFLRTRASGSRGTPLPVEWARSTIDVSKEMADLTLACYLTCHLSTASLTARPLDIRKLYFTRRLRDAQHLNLPGCSLDWEAFLQSRAELSSRPIEELSQEASSLVYREAAANSEIPPSLLSSLRSLLGGSSAVEDVLPGTRRDPMVKLLQAHAKRLVPQK